MEGWRQREGRYERRKRRMKIGKAGQSRTETRLTVTTFWVSVAGLVLDLMEKLCFPVQ